MTIKELNVNFEGIRLGVAIPAGEGKLPTKQIQSIFNLSAELARYGGSMSFVTVDNSSILPRARNVIWKIFAERTDHTHVLFLDDDIVFHANDIMRMIAYTQHDMENEIDVICGAYVTRDGQSEFRIAVSGKTHPEWPNLVETTGIGFGCVVAKIDVLKAVHDRTIDEGRWYRDEQASKKYKFEDERIPLVFDFEFRMSSHQYIGEDILACEKIREAGYQMWVDPSVSLTHLGGKGYNKNYEEYIFERRERA